MSGQESGDEDEEAVGMRAAQVTEHGGPEVIVPADLPRPAPGEGEVLVAVAVVDIGFVETQVRSGWGRSYFPFEPPYVPGSGFAGTVHQVGAGVDPALVGRRVAVSARGTGGAAEYALADAGALAPVPDAVPLLTAAALVHDGTTALALLEVTRLSAGERLLIAGASGGMGTLLVQLAVARGAHVVGLARGDRKTALVRELGAQAAIDTTADGWQAAAREALGGAGADVVLDGVGGRPGLEAFALTATGGRFSAHGAPTGAFAQVDAAEAAARDIELTGIAEVQLTPAAYRDLLVRALDAAALGELRPVIGAVFTLERTAEAHRAIESRELLGKVLLTTSGGSGSGTAGTAGTAGAAGAPGASGAVSGSSATGVSGTPGAPGTCATPDASAP